MREKYPDIKILMETIFEDDKDFQVILVVENLCS
jgi:hypothetical protein